MDKYVGMNDEPVRALPVMTSTESGRQHRAYI
jgi:hypothetical protein